MAALCVMLPAADGPSFTIADFEGPSGLQGWRFSGSSESVTGALTLGPGHRDHGAVLAYRLPCESNATCTASAMWTPSSPLPKKHAPAVSMWIKFPADVEVSLVVKDGAGKTYRFPIASTIEHPAAGAWQRVIVPLSDEKNIKVVEAGIQVQPRFRGIATGSVSFDDVELREASEAFLADPTAEASPREPVELGVNIHLLRDDRSLDLARAAGFTLVRMDMLWANVERAGRNRFFAYDVLLRELDKRKMGVLWILDYGHPDHGGRTPHTPQDVAAFGRFAEAAAAHFKGRNVRYEIWNEPNLSQFWLPAPDASEYAALLREAVAAIRKADPEAKISSGGLSRFDLPFLSRAVDPALAANLTAIGVHPYPQTGPESIAPALAALREWTARAFGERLEIWDTEWGYSSTNAPRDAPTNGHTEAGRKRQAVLAIREILTVWALGLPMAVYYDLRDDGTDASNPEHNYGLLDSDGEEKLAMKAVRFLHAAASSRNFGVIRETPVGVHAVRLDGTKDVMLIVWTDDPHGRRTVEFSKQNLTSATNLTGEPVKQKGARSGRAKVEIDEASGPVYLTWTK